MASALDVTNEVGALKKVIVHSPGPEVLAVTPSNRREFLYDDIIDLEGAKEEHRRFVSILRQFSEVIELRDLLVETLALEEARRFLLERSVEATSVRTLPEQLAAISNEELARRYLEGWRLQAGAFAQKLEQASYILPPLPNLFFTRDASVVVGDAVVVAAMRFESRWPEAALMRTIFGFHPTLGGGRVIYDGSDERRHEFMLEGGDVHPISPDVVLVGLSERTSVAALDAFTEGLFEKTDYTDVIAVVIPAGSTAIHLDMVWTQVDRNHCIAHPPMFRGPTRAPVLHRRKGRSEVSEPASLFAALREVGLEMEPIWAGGETREMREREQWASGCNFFAVGPGKVLSYERNEGTLRAMEAAGFRLVEGEELLLGDDRVSDDERAVITFYGAELVRGGGGPRCMTCPVQREPC